LGLRFWWNAGGVKKSSRGLLTEPLVCGKIHLLLGNLKSRE
jgi:hypothetical protein